MMTLHGYFRSSASWRVRIVLGLKGLAVEQRAHHLRLGEHRAPAYRAINPQGFVPALELDDGRVLTQSLAIAEYLDALIPEPALLPVDPYARARVRAFAQVIASDIHPVQNLRILARLRSLGIDEDGVRQWAADMIEDGLDACERLITDETGPYCFGAAPTLADACLVPQLYNARRFGVTIRWPRLAAIDSHCREHPAFAAADAAAQPDAE